MNYKKRFYFFYKIFYKKIVIKILLGYYTKIPTVYSTDLANVIKAMLQVQPQSRPSCDKILSFPSIIKRMSDCHLKEVEDEELIDELMKTIKIPKNMQFLAETLPPPNYDPLQVK